MPNLWYYTLMRLFRLTRWVGRPQLVIAITFLGFKLLITMAALAAASLKTNKFRFCFMCTKIFSSLINIIVVGLLWNNIPILYSWLRKMRFKSHFGA